MLRVVSHKSAAAARQYYAEGLRREDYYSEGQEVAGKWHGKAAALLGLTGDVTPDAFAALVENRHPETGAQLTPRMKEGRIVGYDLNFHAPKSLSVLHALTGDDEILKAFRSAVAETMAEIEAQVATRIRKGGAQDNRVTGNFAWAEFVHFTARPVGGIPDPHLHVHCFVFNATFDAEEDRWKAAKFREIKQDAPYSEAAFHSRLTDKLVGLGYGIERTRQGWEVKGIPRAVIDKFSRRSAQIDRLAEAKGITDPKQKDTLGAATRENKRQGLTQAELLAAWDVRLTPDEKLAISKVHAGKGRNSLAEKITPGRALDEASEKLFAKNSVVEVKRLVAEALRFGVGQVTPDKVWRELGRREMIVREIKGRVLCTSLSVLAEEVALINYVRSGLGRCAPFVPSNAKLENNALSMEQNAAVRHILKSHDQVIGVRGAAGAGKTTLMADVVKAIQARGLKVFAFAPSASASRETLREAGFANAETVAHLLANRKLQLETRGQVIWLDEAGLVGTADMLEILRIAGDSTKIILTGDTAQHAPVPRGDPFRIMQQYAGLKGVELTETRLAIGIAWFIAAFPAFSEPSQKEVVGLMNRVTHRVNDGDINALNDLTTLPGKYAAPAFITIFQQNYNIGSATAQNRAIGLKCAQLLTTTPGGEEYLVKLLKDAPDPVPNQLYFQQYYAINCMLLVEQKFAVRVLCSGLNDNENGGRAAKTLSKLKLPDAPYPPNDNPDESNVKNVPKWKVWWEAHKDNYVEKVASPSPSPQ